MAKERQLTDGQIQCLLLAEPTMFGDIKIVEGLYARSVSGLRKRGLIEGNLPHAYLTDAGKAKLAEVANV